MNRDEFSSVVNKGKLLLRCMRYFISIGIDYRPKYSVCAIITIEEMGIQPHLMLLHLISKFCPMIRLMSV